MVRPIGAGARRETRTPEEAFGKALTELRVERGITQEELAHKLGYHLSYIGQVERGLKSPTLRTVFNIADAFGISITSLLARTEENLKRKARALIRRNVRENRS